MQNIFPTYQQYPIDIVAGHDWHLTDRQGHTYLDFTSGIGVCNFGYSNETIVQNVTEQLGQIWHTSNLYESALVDEVARALCEPGMLAFFCNSGTEANEAALKLARKATGKPTVLSFNNSFHGRTYGAMSLTGNPDIQAGFAPLVPAIKFADYNDPAAITAIDQQTAAVILEVIQGEGGVVNGEPQWLHDVQTACHAAGALLIIDEVQTGMGRTGQKFAYQNFDLDPDIVTVAKGIGNGLPLGAMIGKQALAPAFGPGTHGTTFGGNKLALASAKGVLAQLTPTFLHEVQAKSVPVWQALQTEIAPLAAVAGISGKGLMIGIQLATTVDVNQVIDQLQQAGILTLSAKHNTLRLLPPLVMSSADLLAGLAQIKTVLTTIGEE
jgi:acetylornithine aminotransferase